MLKFRNKHIHPGELQPVLPANKKVKLIAMIKSLHDFKLGAGFAAFCLFLLFFLIPSQVGSLTEPDALMPVLTTSFILILSIVLMLKAIRQPQSKKSHPAKGKRLPAYTLWIVVVTMVVYAWLLNLTGFLLTSLVAMIALFLVFGVRNYKRIVLITVITLGLLYLSFEKLLYAPLPVGTLIEQIMG